MFLQCRSTTLVENAALLWQITMASFAKGMIIGLVVVNLAFILYYCYVHRPFQFTRPETEQPPDLSPIESCLSYNVTSLTRLQFNQSMYACDYLSACWKLKKMFKEDWDASKPKAAVYILSRTSDAGNLRRTLKELEKNFLGNYTYPVIIFHEKDFNHLIPSITNCTNIDLFFQEVQLEEPSFVFPPARKIFECYMSTQNIGYRHMCRFHAKLVYDLPIMQDLEYYLRLDAHSYITKPVPYDLFKGMKENDLLYLYPCVTYDTFECTHFLWETVDLFVRVKRIKPQFFNKMDHLKMFYNNFEMARLDIFTGSGYQNYINYIDQLGGIYHNRWGDGPIKSFGVSLFVPENQTRQIYDVQYFHREIQLTRGQSSIPHSNNRC